MAVTQNEIPATSPYACQTRPYSPGKVLLATGYEHYCALLWGLSGSEIAAAFEGDGSDFDRERVRMGTELVGSLLAYGFSKSWAHPIGGGTPVRLPEGAWELDDFRARFATSMIDPSRPFDREATPNHWIFVDLEDWNAMQEASVDRKRPDPIAPTNAEMANADAVSAPTEPRYEPDRLLRLPEVQRRTGLSRATIYRRMGAGRFPESVPLSGNVTAWREADVAAWIRNPA